MALIRDANVYDDTESDGTNSKLVAVDDEDDINNIQGEFAVPIDDTTLVYLLERATAHRASMTVG